MGDFEEKPLIDPRDFESVNWQVKMTNMTSRMEIGPSQRIQLQEFSQAGAWIELPSRCCSAGHHLKVSASLTFPGKPALRFEATARVLEVVGQDHQFEDLSVRAAPSAAQGEDQRPTRIRVSWMQYDEASLKAIEESFRERQEQIDEFLRSAKGL